MSTYVEREEVMDGDNGRFAKVTYLGLSHLELGWWSEIPNNILEDDCVMGCVAVCAVKSYLSRQHVAGQDVESFDSVGDAIKRGVVTEYVDWVTGFNFWRLIGGVFDSQQDKLKWKEGVPLLVKAVSAMACRQIRKQVGLFAEYDRGVVPNREERDEVEVSEQMLKQWAEATEYSEARVWRDLMSKKWGFGDFLPAPIRNVLKAGGKKD